ncbi:MAG: hypothetical protein ACOC3E_00595 [Cyanobacteriota bacterium]
MRNLALRLSLSLTLGTCVWGSIALPTHAQESPTISDALTSTSDFLGTTTFFPQIERVVLNEAGVIIAYGNIRGFNDEAQLQINTIATRINNFPQLSQTTQGVLQGEAININELYRFNWEGFEESGTTNLQGVINRNGGNTATYQVAQSFISAVNQYDVDIETLTQMVRLSLALQGLTAGDVSAPQLAIAINSYNDIIQNLSDPALAALLNNSRFQEARAVLFNLRASLLDQLVEEEEEDEENES